jgi:hypothetical protein
MVFLPASTRSVQPGIHFALLLLLLVLWVPLIKLGIISADSWSNMIRHDQKLDQTWSDVIRHDQTWSDMIRHDQTWNQCEFFSVNSHYEFWSDMPGRLARQTCPADLPGRLARQTCPADLPGRLARQTCPADLPGRLAWQTCPADLPGRLARQTCPADLPGRLARQTCPAVLLWQGIAVLLWQGSPAMTRQTCKPWLWQYSVIMNKCSHVAWKSDILCYTWNS